MSQGFNIDGREAYLINIEWMDIWRKYTWFEQTSIGKEPKITEGNHFIKYLPTQINNEVLLLSQDTRYYTLEKENYLNNIIPPYYAEGKDFEIVDKEVWNMFYKKYKGLPIKR